MTKVHCMCYGILRELIKVLFLKGLKGKKRKKNLMQNKASDQNFHLQKQGQMKGTHTYWVSTMYITMHLLSSYYMPLSHLITTVFSGCRQ